MGNDFNDASQASQDGFKRMSQLADADLGGEPAPPDSENNSATSKNLKSVEVDAGRIAEVAHERVTEFQQMLAEEIRARPFRALGWAAAAGLVVGIMSAR
jgi:ElaB/YqjD/DUF883 family membrane-anchored ribosome-binding protein